MHDNSISLVFGGGYLGLRVARLWREGGREVAVVTRSQKRALELKAAGFRPVVADITEPQSLSAIERMSQVATVLFAIGFDAAAGKSRRQVHIEGLSNVVQNLPNTVRHFIYISTTSVYGQNDASWIDENSPCQPVGESGTVFVEAEKLLQSGRLSDRSIILRLAGLYGPSRIPNRDDLIAGKPFSVSPDAYLNLIHVDDAARVVQSIDEHSTPPRTYVVSDGHPVVRRDYYTEAARLLGAPSPVFDAQPAKPSPYSRGATNKRINTARLLAEIPVALQFPTYKQGLAASVAAKQ
jgi:nucleoside-diphosphate-sugar epimerase